MIAGNPDNFCLFGILLVVGFVIVIVFLASLRSWGARHAASEALRQTREYHEDRRRAAALNSSIRQDMELYAYSQKRDARERDELHQREKQNRKDDSR